MTSPSVDRPSPIDRREVVTRHDPRVQDVQPRWPLQLGNGEFAVAVDVTGLQTEPSAHPHGTRHGEQPGTLLGTMAHWGWHSRPGARPYRLTETLVDYRTADGRTVGYPDFTPGAAGPDGDRGTDAERWLRNNPHRLQLAAIGFDLGVGLDALTGCDQHLQLWTGRLTSRFTVPGSGTVTTTTVVHPERDLLAVRVDGDHRPPITLAFPYGNESWTDAADWDSPGAHTSTLRREGDHWVVDRRLDDDGYRVRIAGNGTISPAPTDAGGGLTLADHRLMITPPATGAFEVIIEFLPAGDDAGDPLAGVDDTLAAAAAGWRGFWTSGAALDLGGTDDSRAHELERRAVLSQYLTMINCSGSLPPAETGLLTNSWRGRFHLEMHWWHAAHFPMWGRTERLSPSLDWYRQVLPVARDIAARQGYAGARWPKQVAADGRESPGDIGPFLIWQQPHPIHLAELLHRAHRAAGDETAAAAVLARYGDIVVATAEFMADLVVPTGNGFSLGPPLVPAQESYGSIRARVSDPTFELAYWCWMLRVAVEWRERLGLPPDPRWSEIADGLVPPPVRDGVLAAIAVEPYTIRTDHPSMLAAYGFVPPTGQVGAELAAATMDDVLADWDWESTWGWDYPVLAMTAARLGRGEAAVDALLMPMPKNEHGPNGHNRQTDSLPAYLPGNGGLLAALALMVGGWDGSDAHPGLPADWVVRAEGFVPLLG